MRVIRRRTSRSSVGGRTGLVEPLEPRRLLASPDAIKGDFHEDVCNCGVGHRHDQFASTGGAEYTLDDKWDSPDVTYGYSNLFSALNTSLDSGTIYDAIEEGLLLWTAVSRLTFTERVDPGGPVNDDSHNVETPQIRIGAHNVPDPPGTDLGAHATEPGSGQGGDLHFDTGNFFDDAGMFMEIAAHELGHAIGIGHANGEGSNGNCPAPKPALMDACFQARFSALGDGFLFSDDIAAVRAHYGSGLGYVLDLTGTLYISGTQDANTFNIDASGNSLTVSNSGTGSFTRSMSGVNNVVIYGRGDDDVFNIRGVPAGIGLLIQGDGGDDSVTIGDNDFDSNILGDVTVSGGAGHDTVVINDLLDQAGGDIYNFEFNWMEKPSGGRLTFDNVTLEDATLFGSGNADAFNVRTVPDGLDLTLLGNGGNDTFNIGNDDYDFWINNNVTLAGGTGDDLLFIHDRNDLGDDTHVLLSDAYRKVNSTSRTTHHDFESFILFASNRDVNNTISLAGAPAGSSVYVNTFAGTDTFNVGGGDWDTNLPDTYIAVIADDGAALNILDESDVGNADVYTINGDQIVKTGSGQTQTIETSGVGALVLSASQGGTVIDVQSLDQRTTILGNAGDDSITLRDSFLDFVGQFGVYRPTALDAGLGDDSVVLNSGLGDAPALVEFIGSQSLSHLAIGSDDSALLPPNGDDYLEVKNSVTINGRLGLSDNTFVRRDQGTNLSYYQTRLVNGYNNGAWNGGQPSITSSTAFGGTTTGLGYARAGDIGMTSLFTNTGFLSIGANDLVIRYTLYGDHNLDRLVNLIDFNRLAANFGQEGTTWSRGNSNYDSVTNLLDFNRLAQSFGATLGVAISRMEGDDEEELPDLPA